MGILGFGVWGLGFRVWFSVAGLGFRVFVYFCIHSYIHKHILLFVW